MYTGNTHEINHGRKQKTLPNMFYPSQPHLFRICAATKHVPLLVPQDMTYFTYYHLRRKKL